MSQTSIRMPLAVAIVARSVPDNVIGVDNGLPWHLGTDLKHFKHATQGHAVLMGRKTFESLGRPLPNRLNIVLSRTVREDTEWVKWAADAEQAFLIADAHAITSGKLRFFIIGGAHVYAMLQPSTDAFFLTDVSTGPLKGDARFDAVFDPEHWQERFSTSFPPSAVDDHPFRISYLKRKGGAGRRRELADFGIDDPVFAEAFAAFGAATACDDDRALEDSDRQFLATLGA